MRPMAHVRRQLRGLIDHADLFIALLLVAAGWSTIKMPGEGWARLGGSFIGAGVVLLGSWFARLYERRKLKDRIAKTKTLIAAELINVATGLVAAEEFLASGVRAFEAGSTGGPFNLSHISPRPMPRAASLSGELLHLEEREVDVLTTLETNLAITRQSMDEVTKGQSSFSLLTASHLLDSVRFGMHILAQAFELLAPERQLQLPGRPPELASALLNRLSQQPSKNNSASGDGLDAAFLSNSLPR